MTGTAVVNPPDELWVLSYGPGSDRWYFTYPRAALAINPDGTWHTFASIGDGTGADDGSSFDIAVFVVSPVEGQVLRTAALPGSGDGSLPREPPSIVSKRVTVTMVCGNRSTCADSSPSPR